MVCKITTYSILLLVLLKRQCSAAEVTNTTSVTQSPSTSLNTRFGTDDPNQRYPGGYQNPQGNYPGNSYYPYGNQNENFQRPQQGYGWNSNQPYFQGRPYQNFPQNQGYDPYQRPNYYSGFNPTYNNMNQNPNYQRPYNANTPEDRMPFPGNVNSPYQNAGFPYNQGGYSNQPTGMPDNLMPIRYPPQGTQYPPQSGQYPQQGGEYPQQGGEYPQQGREYPSQGGEYPQQGRGYPSQGEGYPPQGTQYPPQGYFQPNFVPGGSNFQPSYTGNFNNIPDSRITFPGNDVPPYQNQYPPNGLTNQGFNTNPNQNNLQTYPSNNVQGNAPYLSNNPGNNDDSIHFPNQGNNMPGFNQGLPGNVIGTPQTSPVSSNTQQINSNNGANANGTTAILGKPVFLSSATSPPDQLFNGSTESPSQKQCVQNCQSTSEYVPICGTNNVTYINPGKFQCALNCGVAVNIRQMGRCNMNPS